MGGEFLGFVSCTWGFTKIGDANIDPQVSVDLKVFVAFSRQ